MKRQFPKVPILGLTATATSSVIADVQNILNIPGCLVLKASFNRPNLKYEVVCKSSCQKDNVTELESMLKNRFNGLSGIIYCFSVKDSDEIASELRNRGVKARSYHAQLDAKSRSSVHKSWASNSIQVIVATVAFGMGIDKPDVRFVIHHSMPKSMENFYQESGRAGRDDHLASCILFYRFPDIFRQSTMVFTEQKGLEHLYAMIAYCLDLSRCRRAIIAEHFGERWDASDCNNMCDHCDKFSPYVEKTKAVTKEYKTLIDILEHCNMIEERLTSQKLIEAWHGKGPPKLRPPGLKATLLSRENCERIVALLLLESYLIEEFHFTPYSTISYINIGSRKPPFDQELMLPMPYLRAKTASDSKEALAKFYATDPSTLSAKSKSDSSARKNHLSSSSSKTSSKNKEKLSTSEASMLSESLTNPTSKNKPRLKADGSESSSKHDRASLSDNGTVKLNIINAEKSHFKNGMTSGSKRSPTNIDAHQSGSASTKKQKTQQEIILSDDELLSDSWDMSGKITAVKHSEVVISEDEDSVPENVLKFDDYDIKSHKKKVPYKRIVPTLTLSDSD